MKKIDYAKFHLQQLNSIITCPFCQSDFMIENNSLICKNNHTFNISKKGTVILYKTSKVKEDRIYNDNLFISRRNFINLGYYDELHTKICKIINEYNTKTILDMGCGEGSHDIKIINNLLNKKISLIGIDLAKNGIDMANDFINNNFIGIVGDLNNLPIKNKSIDLILNILSPSNEKEIARVLKKDGIIIKVTPKKEYLYELRDALGIKEYENEKLIDKNIAIKYNIIQKEEINKTFHINKENLKYLVNMTPLMNNINAIPNIKSITIALNIYLLKVK